MIEESEVLNLFLTIGLYLFLFYLLRVYKTKISKFWHAGIVCIILSNVFTVSEGFVLPITFNLLEHFTFTVACIFFLTGLIDKEKIVINHGKPDIDI